jgi:hypothetical protein
MTKKLILSLTALLSLTLTQAQLYIGANAGINNTKLYNSSDAKADERQDYVLTLKPQFGLELGYKINNNVSVGIQPQLYKAGQKYTGTKSTLNNTLANATVNLEYLQIPIYMQLQLGKNEGRISNLVRLGAYYGIALSSNVTENYLFVIPSIANDYLQKMEITIKDNTLNSYYTYTPPNTTMTVDTLKAKMSSPLYLNQDYGINLAYGLGYKLSNNLKLQILLNASLGLANIENSKSIALSDITTGQFIDSISTGQIRYSRFSTNTKSTDPVRSVITNNRAIGLQIGIIYMLGNKEKLQTKKL